jgi:transcriptional regulator with XRE-family HTH domain
VVRKLIDDRERVAVQEDFILDATEAIWEQMRERGMRKSDLAAKLGVSKAYITQALDGGRNLTLRSLADFAWALECTPRVLFGRREFDESQQVFRSQITGLEPVRPIRLTSDSETNADYVPPKSYARAG